MTNVNLLFGYDTESPYGDKASTEEGAREREVTLRTVDKLNSLFEEYSGFGRTFFILGSFLESTSEHFMGNTELRTIFSSDDPLVDIQQHSYSHVPFRRIATRPDKDPMLPSQIEQDVRKASSLIYRIFGRAVIGVRAPLGYAGGLDNEEVVNALLNAGVKYISSDLRSKDWGIEPPLVEDGKPRQPRFYSTELGNLLEIPSHGWQDTAFTGKSKTIGTAGYPTTAAGIFEYFNSLMIQGKELAEDTGKEVFLGLCLHPQAIDVYDPNLDFHKKLLDHFAKHGVNVSSYTVAYEKLAKKQ
ncbi:MAG TPA: polysaccharide deacetylase family protein [Candidatus Nanoarchaeia archaeon]|nr:polysaccharide deacetylase family protein [Candidatus Nanoarchaeia archaeon]